MKEAPKSTSNWIPRFKSLPIYNKVLLGAIFLFFVFASIRYDKLSIDQSNIREVQFKSLKKNKMYKDLGYSYRLKLLESAQEFIIKADYAPCLKLDTFHQVVQEGDVIKISTERSNPSLICFISKGDIILLDINCVATQSNYINRMIPILIALSIFLVWGLLYKIKQDQGTA